MLGHQLDFQDQRSKTWNDTHQTFNKPAESKIKETAQNCYELITGAMAEQFAQHFMKNPKVLDDLGFGGYKFFAVGFVLSDDGTDGKAPDGFLMGKNADGIIEFVCVEFKKLKTHANNKGRKRALQIASLQTASCSALLAKNVVPSELCIVRSLLIICCILEERFDVRAFVSQL